MVERNINERLFIIFVRGNIVKGERLTFKAFLRSGNKIKRFEGIRFEVLRMFRMTTACGSGECKFRPFYLL